MDIPAAARAPSPRPLAGVSRWPSRWVACMSVAMVAFAWWLQEPAWWRLAPALIGAVAAAWFLAEVPTPRVFAILAVAALVIGIGMGAADARTLASMRANWGAWSTTERDERAREISVSIGETAAALRRAVEAAVADSTLVAEALAGTVRGLAVPLGGNVESALLVYRGGMLVARAGQMHTPVSPGLTSGVSVVSGPFHTSLVARARTADSVVEVVSVALVASAPPADRFTRSLLQTLPADIDVAHVRIDPTDSLRIRRLEPSVLVPDGDRVIARVTAFGYGEGEMRLQLQEQARVHGSAALLVVLLAFLLVAWRRPAGTVPRITAAGAVLLVVAIAPLPALSNVSSLFDPRSYFSAMGGPLTSTVAALLFTAALGFSVVLFASRGRRQRPSRILATLVVVLGACGGPLLLRNLARGISLPPSGANFVLWSAWQLALALAGATVLLAAASMGRSVLGNHRNVPAPLPVFTALISALLAPSLLSASGVWPAWYLVPWGVAILTTTITRRGLSQVLAVAVVTGAGASTLTWGATVRARTRLAEHDLARIGASDFDAQRLLERFAISLRDDVQPARTGEALLQRFAGSELARAGYSARLARWSPQSIDAPMSTLDLTPVLDTMGAQAYIALIARESGAVEFREVRDGLRRVLLAAVPASDGTVTTIALPPRTSLLHADPFSSFIGLTSDTWREPPYRLSLSAANLDERRTDALVWRRNGNALHGDGVAGDGADVNRVHAEVDLGGLDVLLPRGALLIMLDVLAVLGIWAAVAIAEGVLGRLLSIQRARWSRSYRLQLSGAMMVFFLAPALTFAVWAWYRLQGDDRATRELLVRETLRVAAAEQEIRPIGSAPSSTGAPLFLYRDGVLRQASDPLLDALAPLGRLLPIEFSDEELGTDDTFVSRRLSAGVVRALVGFRLLTRPGALNMPGASVSVLTTPARGNEFALDDRREDLGILVLCATMLGALAAIWSSGFAARALARPVGALRKAALDIAAGRPAPALGSAPATEFAPVYRAFMRMADDLQTSRAALEAAQRRTEAVLQNVATGVVAFRRDGGILLANPRAGALLGDGVRQPAAALATLPAALMPLVAQCTTFLARTAEHDAFEEEAFELTQNGRQLQARLTRLPNGAVLTVDDITDLASAQRVLAWGAMARQVAHEIKNPLTPIRLGVQHLRRAYRDGRGDFGEILDRNVGRILEEIDHLDEIARAFSRYGTAPSERAPGVPVNVPDVVRDVVDLERLGDHAEPGQRVAWEVRMPTQAGLVALAQRDELREVLLNVLENARLAGASRVTVTVSPAVQHIVLEVVDDGGGITPEVLPHVFEPHFSTRTSGSGLGLAISRRLIEGWGGTIGVASGTERGTTVRIALLRADAEASEASEAGRR